MLQKKMNSLIIMSQYNRIHRIHMERFLKPWLQIKWIFKLSRLSRLNTFHIAASRAFYDQVRLQHH